MKKASIIALTIVSTVVFIALAGVSLYRYFVDSRIQDGGRMENPDTYRAGTVSYTHLHNDAILFGMQCAESGIAEQLDFFIRHYDSRPTAKVFLAEDTAESVLLQTDLTAERFMPVSYTHLPDPPPAFQASPANGQWTSACSQSSHSCAPD